jgi:Tfp pilus assembly PilM family ATPase/Tfp pilus assembly protein PilN
VLGIDTGAKEIRIACVKKQGGRLLVTGWHHATLPDDSVDKDGTIINTSKVAAVISSLLREAQYRDRECILAFSGRGAVIQISSVPKMPLKELDEVVRGELEAIPSLAEEGFIFDYYTLSALSKAEAGKTKIVYAGISRKILDSYLVCCHEAGLKVVGIDLACLSLLNVVHPILNKAPAASGVVLIHDRATYTMIVEQGKIALMYSSNVGLYDLITPQNEIDQEKSLRLVREFERALKVYSIEFQTQPPTSIVLSWNSAVVPQLADVLSRQMEDIDVRPVDVSQEFTLQSLPPDQAQLSSADYAVAIGAAKRGFARVTHEAPLRKLQEYVPRPGYITKKVMQVGIVALVVVCCVASARMFFALGVNRINKKIQRTDREIAALDRNLQELYSVQKTHAQLKEKVAQQVIYMQELTRVPWPQLLSEVTKRLPERAWLDVFQARENGLLVLRGMTFSLDIVADFIRNLKGFSYFETVNLESTELRKVKHEEEEFSTVKFGLEISLYKKEAEDAEEQN